MPSSPTSVEFDGETMVVHLDDGLVLKVPLARFPRLLAASPAQRQKVELSRIGLHWDDLDEDISIAGLLAGRGDRALDSSAASAGQPESPARYSGATSTRRR